MNSKEFNYRKYYIIYINKNEVQKCLKASNFGVNCPCPLRRIHLTKICFSIPQILTETNMAVLSSPGQLVL